MAVTHKTSIDEALTALVRGTQCDPFALLGPHADEGGTIVRAFRPAARSIDLHLVTTDTLLPMVRRGAAGIFEVRIPDMPTQDARARQEELDGRERPDGPAGRAPDYRLRITYAGGDVFEIDDPYRYGRVLTDFDLHLLSQGTHYRAFEKLGARRIALGTTTGVHFAVWAPNADRVSVVGDFNAWDGRVTPMRSLVTGVWEIFIPDLAEGE